MPSLIPQQAWARRLVYELVYAWPSPRTRTFNVGFAPASEDIRRDSRFARQANQIQLYAELFETASLSANQWQGSSVLEVGAGCGGGLMYLKGRHSPKELIGIDVSSIAAARGRRLGVDVRQGDATDLPFESSRFDCVLCIETATYLDAAPFARELARVTKPGATILFGEISGSFAEAEDRFRQLANFGGFDLVRLRDATEGARRSIVERGAELEHAIAWLPGFLRERMKETAAVEGSERYSRWTSGQLCFAMAVLRRPAEDLSRHGSVYRAQSASAGTPGPAMPGATANRG